MTESLSSLPACWASLDRCLHEHHSVIAGDLRLQAAHAAFQLQLATLRAIRPAGGAAQLAPAQPALRDYLAFQLLEVSANILAPAADAAPAAPDAAAAAKAELDQRALLELAEDTVRYLRDNPSLWTRVGLAALQVRALADLHNAYALETGALAPAGDPADRFKESAAEIVRLIRQELDPLVRAHEIGAPAFVADYEQARQPSAAGSESTSTSAPRPGTPPSSRIRKMAEFLLPN